jgi:hypothetical protein
MADRLDDLMPKVLSLLRMLVSGADDGPRRYPPPSIEGRARRTTGSSITAPSGGGRRQPE